MLTLIIYLIGIFYCFFMLVTKETGYTPVFYAQSICSSLLWPLFFLIRLLQETEYIQEIVLDVLGVEQPAQQLDEILGLQDNPDAPLELI